MLYTQNIIVGASPFIYKNTSGYLSKVFIIGGTVSAIQFSRDTVNFFTNIQPIILAPGDVVKVTYSVAPTMTLVPLGQIL